MSDNDINAIFYDLESLDNAFTLCAFNRRLNLQEVFVLLDDPKPVTDPSQPAPVDLYREYALNWRNSWPMITQTIYARNPNFNGAVTFYDLRTEEANKRLATILGVSDAYNIHDMPTNLDDPVKISQHTADSYLDAFRPICDTHPSYDPQVHPYLMGYNSSNYDLTMLAHYFANAWSAKDLAPGGSQFVDAQVGDDEPWPLIFTPLTASRLRQFNNLLFTEEFIDSMPNALLDNDTSNRAEQYNTTQWRIRQNMLRSGRHVDVSNLNEKQRKVGLKRLLGMLGYQILESDKLSDGVDHISTMEELAELIAYNVSDTVNLAHLFDHRSYTGQFMLKRGLLQEYPELIFQKKPDAYAPDTGNLANVRNDRLRIDSTSAQFATNTLCPYGNLDDIKTVSFDYPHPDVIARLKEQDPNLDIRPRNVLDETEEFMRHHFAAYPHVLEKFQPIIDYYRSIEGKNFNDSDAYTKRFGKDAPETHTLSEIPKSANNIFYHDAQGNPTTCFVTFSTGGIHGAEFNQALYEADLEEWTRACADLEEVISRYPDPLTMRLEKDITMNDGRVIPARKFIKSGVTIKKMKEDTDTDMKTRQERYYRQPDPQPEIFKTQDDGSTKINPRYVFTSADETNHEDFTSYYPNMLRMMNAFYNAPLGEDRYAQFFENKQTYGRLMKDPSLSAEERARYQVLREGMKLILNSASGAGDTNYQSKIRMNNRIISMRIIGQLFTFRIGQAQALRGARIISTNTDGLYSVMEENLNNQILADESKQINVEIEPGRTVLISKDSNNRMEIHPQTQQIEAASGGSLACFADTDPTKSLAHPAVIDWALAQYLLTVHNDPERDLSQPFDPELGMALLHQAQTNPEWDKPHILRMFQNVVASSRGSRSYIFSMDPTKPLTDFRNCETMQHYNRVFLVKDGTPDARCIMYACMKKVTPAQLATRKRRNKEAGTPNAPIYDHSNAIAKKVLAKMGIYEKDKKYPFDLAIKKINGIEREWPVLIENRSLFDLDPTQQDALIQALDLDKYLGVLEATFDRNWRNAMPQ